MLKNITKLELQLNNRNFQLLCDNDSPIADIKEILFQFQKFVGQIEDQIKSKQEAEKAQEENKVEPIQEEVKQAE